jgi:hypothetical protein
MTARRSQAVALAKAVMVGESFHNGEVVTVLSDERSPALHPPIDDLTLFCEYRWDLRRSSFSRSS